MEFEGRVKQVLPVRSGTSQRTGKEFTVLPFVFEYFEHESDRYSDTVLLESFDENVIAHLQEGMEVRCGFGHRAKNFEGRIYNEIRLYKIEIIRKQKPKSTTAADPQAAQQVQQPQPPNPEDNDELPF